MGHEQCVNRTPTSGLPTSSFRRSRHSVITSSEDRSLSILLFTFFEWKLVLQFLSFPSYAQIQYEHEEALKDRKREETSGNGKPLVGSRL
jgi:hypothetical protein